MVPIIRIARGVKYRKRISRTFYSCCEGYAKIYFKNLEKKTALMAIIVFKY